MKKEVIVDIKRAYILSIILFFLSFVIGAILQVIVRDNYYIKTSWVAIIFMFIIIPLHEGLHAVGFIYLSKAPRESVKLGFHKEYFAPYCHCSNFENTKSGYIKSLFLPNIILSIITAINLFFVDNIFWSLIFGFVVSSGAGDYYMAYLVSKYKNNAKFIDHPTEPGFYVVY